MRQQLQPILHPQPISADARSAVTLAGLDGDAGKKCVYDDRDGACGAGGKPGLRNPTPWLSATAGEIVLQRLAAADGHTGQGPPS
jgi:hypothetical protein